MVQFYILWIFQWGRKNLPNDLMSIQFFSFSFLAVHAFVSLVNMISDTVKPITFTGTLYIYGDSPSHAHTHTPSQCCWCHKWFHAALNPIQVCNGLCSSQNALFLPLATSVEVECQLPSQPVTTEKEAERMCNIIQKLSNWAKVALLYVVH